jgi:hypothetical protein
MNEEHCIITSFIMNLFFKNIIVGMMKSKKKYTGSTGNVYSV